MDSVLRIYLLFSFNLCATVVCVDIQNYFTIVANQNIAFVVKSVKTSSIVDCVSLCLSFNGPGGCLAASFNTATRTCHISNLTLEDGGVVSDAEWTAILPASCKYFYLYFKLLTLCDMCYLLDTVFKKSRFKIKIPNA